MGLEVVAFRDYETRPRYEALSYAWGSSDCRVEIFVTEPGSDETTIRITSNLLTALRHLRFTDQPRVMWIDALCINQQDAAEKSQQVAMMAEIYTYAETVSAWLGPEGDNSEVAINCIKAIATHVSITRYHELEARTGDTSWVDPSKPAPFDDDQIYALAKFFQRSWFERLWVWQEVRNGRHRAYMECGSQLLYWPSVCDAINYLWIKRIPSCQHESDLLSTVLRLREITSKMELRFLDSLEATRSCKCSDQRDRVYAVLGVAGESARPLGILPDYLKTIQEVYMDAAASALQTDRNLHIMRHLVNVNSLPDLPSWVPDWTAKRDTEPFYLANAGVGVTGEILKISGRVLTVKGLEIAKISRLEPFVSDLGHKTPAGPKNIDNVRNFLSRLLKRGLVNRRQELIPNFCRAVCANSFAENMIPFERSRPTRDACEIVLTNLLGLNSPNSVTQSDRLKVYRHIGNFCTGRCFFVSGDGGFGLAPRFAQPDDLIVALFGCVPLVTLRPQINGGYRVIGETFFNDYMDREAILGYLPENVEGVMQHSRRYFRGSWAWRNRDTGILYPGDPRLGDLPHGWLRVDHEHSSFYEELLHSDTGERRTSANDPRMELRFLEAKGLRYKTFDLY